MLHRSLKRSRKRVIRYSILAANIVLLVAVLGFVVKSPNNSNLTRQSSAFTTGSSYAVNPLDQLSSADIAVNIARMANLYEAASATNKADSIKTQLAASLSTDTVVSKPQVVSTALKSIKDLQKYTVQPGDTVSSLAAKFGITSDSIRWSNNISGETIASGIQLWIPPVNGIVYQVKVGDTPDGVAQRLRANKDAIIAFNDAEIGGLKVGKYIVIPEGSRATVNTLSYSYSVSSGFAWGTGAIYGYNGYDYGYCTWYIASKIAVPSNWGNANTWDSGARATGWTVSKVPRVGAVAQTDAGGLGHVGIVEAVSADGTMIKYSDMNGLAGWGRVGFSDWVPAAGKFHNFIYH